MRIAGTTPLKSAGSVSHFIRFGDIPEGNKSRMWTAPNTYQHSRIGQILPGLSAYG
jgi:hypothetical protein